MHHIVHVSNRSVTTRLRIIRKVPVKKFRVVNKIFVQSLFDYYPSDVITKLSYSIHS